MAGANRGIDKACIGYADRTGKKMKVLQVGMSYNPGGIESFVMTYYRQMRKMGVQFDFISMFPQLAYEKEILSLGGRVFHTTDARKHPMAFQKEMMQILKKEQYDVVHVNMLSAANIVPLLAAKQSNVPIIAAHSHNSSTPGLLRNILHRVNKSLIPRTASVYFACSEVAGHWLFSEKIVKGNAFHLIHNALCMEKFLFSESVRKEVRAELHLDGKFVVGHVGRFEEQKNHLFLIEVFQKVAEARKDAVLLLIGDGEVQEKARQKVKDCHLEEKVRFLGIRKDVDRLWKAMDVFVFPSLFEGLPIVALEAQASGVYSVMADTITREVKLTDHVEFLSLEAAKEKWRDCILAAEKHKQKEAYNSVIKRQFCEAGYDIESAAQTLLSYYESGKKERENGRN